MSNISILLGYTDKITNQITKFIVLKKEGIQICMDICQYFQKETMRLSNKINFYNGYL